MPFIRNGTSASVATEPAGAASLERRTREIGRELLRLARENREGFLSSRFWSDRLMEWAMHDPPFKVQLFRFVDAFPMLVTPEMVHDYLVDYLGQPGVALPTGMEFGMKLGGLARGAMARAISNRIAALARNFIAGTDPESALPKLEDLWNHGVAASVDLLGEACVSQEEADAYQKRYLDLVEHLSDRAREWPADSRLESDHLGPVPRANVSIKISALSARTDPIDFEGSIHTLREALRPILGAAARRGVLVNFDMEQYALKDLTIALFQRCAEEIDFPAGIALQAYLKSVEQDGSRLVDWARRIGRQVTVRLIKGAYWDYEVIQAEQKGWPVPVWIEKRETDASFERTVELLLAAAPRRPGEGGVKLAIGSHNVRSIARTLALAEQYGLPESAVELQMLYGMADQLKAAVLRRSLRLREYVPVGRMIPGMAYLVRRLLENTSNQSWLRAGFFENVPDDELLASVHAATLTVSSTPDVVARGRSGPQLVVVSRGTGYSQTTETQVLSWPERHALSPAIPGLDDGRPFFNEPQRDFSQEDQRERFARAIRAAKVPEVPHRATADEAREAVARAAAAFPAWRDTDPLDRSRLIARAGAILRRRRDEIAGIVIRESGKTWREADADVCEAIDFCQYYARVAVGLFQPKRLGQFVGELDLVWHEPRGVAVVISPWNFPLAILTGMTTAALVTGNTVLVKPSTQTRGIAKAVCEMLHEAGVPAGALQFVAGLGNVAGSALVRDPRVALIAFTGSKDVGLDILEAAGRTGPEQGHVKKVVCEMGGKNAIIVDDSADLDEAVLGVRQSAFGYSGQKCSACSRAIVLDRVYEQFLHRLVESTRALVIGDPLDPGTDLGPVIDEAAARKIRQYIEVGMAEGSLELACQAPASLEEKVGKPYVGPHIFSCIRPHHRLANEEVFGPVLSVIRATDFEESLAIANAPAYKLTGGVYSRKPSHLEAARRRFRVGDLYLNRGITGALVGRQPFGGFGLSGTGTQAGGPDYLLQFVQPRCCTENTLRHGFAPGLG